MREVEKWINREEREEQYSTCTKTKKERENDD